MSNNQSPNKRNKRKSTVITKDFNRSIKISTNVSSKPKSGSMESNENYYNSFFTTKSKNNTIKADEVGQVIESNRKGELGRVTPSPSPNKYSFVIKRIVPNHPNRPCSYQSKQIAKPRNKAGGENTNLVYNRPKSKDGLKINYNNFKKDLEK